MKRILIILCFILSLQDIYSQVPGSFRYQAVLRDENGQILANKLVSLRIRILNSIGLVYTLNFSNKSTNDYGIIALDIGEQDGGVPVGGFDNINWGSDSYYLETSVDINNGSNFVLMGTSQILAVPYALTALNVENKQDLELVNDVLKITNNENATEIPLSSYIGIDTDNQNLSSNVIGNNVSISIEDGNSINFDMPTDFVNLSTGGTFSGSINATNLLGTGRLNLQRDFTLAGTSSVQFTSTGATVLTLPLSGVLATEAWVNQSIAGSNDLLAGHIWIGGSGGEATTLDASASGNILIGSGSTLQSVSVSGDATIASNGFVNLSATTVVPGTYFSMTVDSKGRITNGSNPTTLLGFGITDALGTDLSNGRILIGEGGVATEFDIRGDGQIIVGNGTTAFSRSITGDITLLNSGVVTVNSIGTNSISLGGAFQTSGDDIELVAGLGGSLVTLPQTGTLANQSYVNTQITNNNSSYVGSTNITTLGTISTGIWSAGAVTSSGAITGTSIIRDGGTSSQFLKADGSIDANIYLTSSSGVSSITGTLNQITTSATTGDITLSLPSVINGLTSVTSTNFVGSLTGTASALQTGHTISITGDLIYTSPSFDGSGNVTAVGTLATINANTGSFGTSSLIPTLTVNEKGLITGVSTNAVMAPAGTLTGATLANNVLNSSLTSVGTISNGIWNAGSVTSSGPITGTSIIRSGGTSTQFLKADGSVDASVYLTSSSGVSSIAGTTNQINVSSSTGNVSLSLPSVVNGLSSVTSTNFVGALTGNATTATSSPAENLTGTALPVAVVGSSLTSVGTITAGVWNAGSVSSSGAITGTSIIRSGGTSSQFLKADGSIDANTYLTAVNEVADESIATALQISFTLSSNPSVNSVVKMFINGARVSNGDYSVVGTAVEYNGADLLGSEIVQFDYYY